MKKLVITAALVGTTVLAAPSAFATGSWENYFCGTGFCSDDADFNQKLLGFQKAINNIVDFDDATKIVQEAVNAGNLINVGDADSAAIDLANVHQYADVLQKASNNIDGGSWFNSSDIDDATQSATNVVNSISGDLVKAVEQKSEGSQEATNNISGDYHSKLTNLEQAATNVVNTLTAGMSKTIEQTSHTSQYAANNISGGWGGYDADVGGTFEWDDEDAVRTQTAVNAANLVNLGELTGAITQHASYNPQTALNTAEFAKWGTVYDLGQSATNVLNNVTVGEIDPSIFCGCYDGWEVNQHAYAEQTAQNLIRTMGDVNNAIQSATNVANSISVPSGNE
ncbi:hypothetical protein SAMN06295905_1955 [Devosia lucknowensis]|uniref:Uncharacterized protein n=1 Tax=Devosia lucknowensis TaxID=1096929 RepID=A0A1Y6F9V4_9HYPH|nr:hypothetical protein [Devosia lucknowensis]SMQ71694.1 hypothetical protein SAMN06295905_1955 [Devosia lucknowensis]